MFALSFLLYTRNRGVWLKSHALRKTLVAVVVDTNPLFCILVAVDEFSDSDESQVSVNTLMRLKVSAVRTDKFSSTGVKFSSCSVFL